MSFYVRNGETIRGQDYTLPGLLPFDEIKDGKGYYHVATQCVQNVVDGRFYDGNGIPCPVDENGVFHQTIAVMIG